MGEIGDIDGDEESDDDDLSMDEIKHAMAMHDNHSNSFDNDDTDAEDNDYGADELHRIMAAHNMAMHNAKVSASAILSRTLGGTISGDACCNGMGMERPDGEHGGAHICE